MRAHRKWCIRIDEVCVIKKRSASFYIEQRVCCRGSWLMVIHSTAAASRAKRVLFIKDGILYNQIFRGDKTERQMFQEISDTLTVMASEVKD